MIGLARRRLPAMAVGLLVVAVGCQRPVETARVAAIDPSTKIELDLDALDANGLAGPPDGKVAVSYEFRIPDSPENRAAVKAIDPEIGITAGSPGRVNAGPGFALCVGSTHTPRHREILLELASLPFVERIIRCDFE